MYAQRRDLAEPPILEYLDAIGAKYQQMDKSAGFDLLVFYRGLVHIVEIKTVTKPKTRVQLVKMLTPNEHKTMLLVEAAGCDYNIVTSPDDLTAILSRRGVLVAVVDSADWQPAPEWD